MQIPPIEKARLSARLLSLRAQLSGGALSPLDKARVSAEALNIRKQLGAPALPVPQMDAEAAAENAADDGLSDDPNSDNYRYADVGYIPGSRKEEAAGAIRKARSEGRMLRGSDIDFAAIEQNPREARALVVKSNLFGVVDWAELRESGTDPAAAYLMDRVYSSLDKEPSEDSPQARRAYVQGIETLRTRLERCQTPKEVVATLDEIRDEVMGSQLDADETARYVALQDQVKNLGAQIAALETAQLNAQNAMYAASGAHSKAKRDFDNRLARGWKVEPQHEQAVQDAAAADRAAAQAWRDMLDQNKPLLSGLRDTRQAVYQERGEILGAAKARNLALPINRAWTSLGDRFVKSLMFRSRMGSESFAKHVSNALSGEPKEWEWADKKSGAVIQGAPKTPTKKRQTFALKVVDKFDRKGGRPITVNSTRDLQQLCGLRAVQSGNWVLDDKDSSKWHVEQSAGAMMDMADVVGLPESVLGFGGRLGLAFGARGKGGKGAAAAHYEPVRRAINITKMNGGGSIGHENWHALDNILPGLLRGEAGSATEYGSHDPELVPEGPVRDAFAGLKRALSDGDTRLPETIKFSPNTLANARLNLDNPTNDIARRIKAAGNAQAAVLVVDAYFGGMPGDRAKKMKKTWRTFAAAYFSPADSTEVELNTGRGVSRYMAEAKQLDGSKGGEYWSSATEMAARAFQSYLEDKLAAMGRQNDYLSCLADNRHHYFPDLGQPFKPYPEGEERDRINAAFDALFKTLRDDKTFEKALANTALLDSIFGVNHD
ncbi:LPD1 domain-containing protein [Pseudomonas sp. NPDC090208]|uniref:LPD1 domain-containing protein n=1 Tax=Pseudomonas sp. NPDC090208 TaxID=3364478 RepID=UPI00380E83A4